MYLAVASRFYSCLISSVWLFDFTEDCSLFLFVSCLGYFFSNKKVEYRFYIQKYSLHNGSCFQSIPSLFLTCCTDRAHLKWALTAALSSKKPGLDFCPDLQRVLCMTLLKVKKKGDQRTLGEKEPTLSLGKLGKGLPNTKGLKLPKAKGTKTRSQVGDLDQFLRLLLERKTRT